MKIFNPRHSAIKAVSIITLVTILTACDHNDSDGGGEVADTTAPVITLIGDADMNIEYGSAYIEEGASAVDDIDGDISTTVVVDASAVNIDAIGSYSVTYRVSDANGNRATQITRTVNIIDTTAPDITLQGSATVEIEQGTAYVDDGATASDILDGTISVTVGGDTVDNTTTPGTYTITYTATDAAGNVSTATRTVTVGADVTAPVIIIAGDASISIIQNTIYTDAGATATDVVDGIVAVEKTGLVNTTTPGTYTIIYTATDAASNEAVTTRTVTVGADDTAPVIELEGLAIVEIEQGTAYVDDGATATDNVDGNISADIEVDKSAVNVDAIGTYTITYNVSDAANNAATEVTRTVTVVGFIASELTGHFSYSDVGGITVAGLTYTTDTLNGVTDESGAFSYLLGEEITFSLGETVIGDTVDAKAVMNPEDLVPDAVMYTTTAQVELMSSGDPLKPSRLAFNKFHNILSFLHTLDEDADPDTNGIVINDGTAALFITGQVNFEQPYIDFQLNKKLRYITHQAQTDSYLSTAAIKKAGVAIEHYYVAQQPIAHTLAARTKRTIDDENNNDDDSVHTYTYDTVGNWLETIQWKGTLSETVDTHDIKYNYVMDSNGNATLYTLNKEADGYVPRPNNYTYDINGNMIARDSLNSAATKVTEYLYVNDINNGNVVSYIRDKLDSDPKSDKYFTYEYDANANRTASIYLNNGPEETNKKDYTKTYTYTYNNGDGELTKFEEFKKFKNDAQPTLVNTVNYDVNGYLLTLEIEGGVSTTYTYDGATGYLETRSVDNVTTSYEYNAAGNETKRTVALDGNPTSITTHTYDGTTGLRTETSVDTDADEVTPNEITTHEYNNGTLTSSTTKLSDTVINTTTYEYQGSTWLAVLRNMHDGSTHESPHNQKYIYMAPPINKPAP